MSEAKPGRQKGGRGAGKEADRERRLAEALRANLGRRKAQARARKDEPPLPGK